MSHPDPVDDKLRHAMERYRSPDLEAMTRRITGALAAQRARESARATAWRWIIVPIAAAACVALAMLGFSWSGGQTTEFAGEQNPPLEPQPWITGPDPSPGADPLLARTDIETILLPAHRHLVVNDPALRPHSIWDQPL